MDQHRRRDRAILGVFVAFLLFITAGGIALVDGGDSTAPAPSPPAAGPELTLSGPGDKTIPAPPPAVAVAAAAGVADHSDGRDETPEGLSRAQIEQKREKLEDLAQHDQFPTVAPDAAPSWPGCTSRFVGNYSSRGGVKPTKLVAHITVSRNRPGWSDVWGIVAFFDSRASQASSHFVIDGEGHCAYIVRTGDKAWTNAGGNPISIQTEFIAYGDEGRLTAAQYKKGGEVFARAAKLYGIPIRRGSVIGCLGGLSGTVEHRDGGLCWGGHTDIFASSGIPLAPLITAEQVAAGPRKRTITAADRRACRGVRSYRDRRNQHLKPTAAGTRRFKARLAREKARGFRCVDGRVKRR